MQLDIWGNVTYFKVNNEWYKQSFFEDKLIKYEDYLGNFWIKEFGDFPYYNIIFEFTETKLLNFKLSCSISDMTIKINTYINHFGFTIGNVVSRTVAMDLIPVTPMESPTANIHYIDYIYKESFFSKIKRLIFLHISKIITIFTKYKLNNYE